MDLTNIFGEEGDAIRTYQDFWAWFLEHEEGFHATISNKKDIESGFINPFFSVLDRFHTGLFCMAGTYGESQVELVITAEGVPKHIVFAEELVAAAPEIPRWKFTALKQASPIEDIAFEMDGEMFDSESLSFYPIEHPEYTDFIDITICHASFNEEKEDEDAGGIFHFVDNYLGELKSISTIDNMEIIGNQHATRELIPIVKLRDFLIWREKEFLEKYEASRYNTEEDNHTSLQAILPNGQPLLLVVNSSLLEWEGKVSHPWIMLIHLNYEGEENGLPSEATFDLLEEIEEAIMKALPDEGGYLNIGRETAEGAMSITMACKDFRKPSKVMQALAREYEDKLDIDYDIFRDKYWQVVERYREIQNEVVEGDEDDEE